MSRKRHPNKDLAAILKEAEKKKGWRITEGRYYTMWCPCPEKHKKTVVRTPSNPNYVKDLLGELRRSTCWERIAP